MRATVCVCVCVCVVWLSLGACAGRRARGVHAVVSVCVWRAIRATAVLCAWHLVGLSGRRVDRAARALCPVLHVWLRALHTPPRTRSSSLAGRCRPSACLVQARPVCGTTRSRPVLPWHHQLHQHCCVRVWRHTRRAVQTRVGRMPDSQPARPVVRASLVPSLSLAVCRPLGVVDGVLRSGSAPCYPAPWPA
jgi:hypothetical protein